MGSRSSCPASRSLSASSCKDIDGELARLAAAPGLTVLDLRRIERQLEEEFSKFADLLRGHAPRGRHALKELLVDRAEFTPVESGNGKRTYAFRGELSYGVVLREAVSMRGVPSGIRTRALAAITFSPVVSASYSLSVPKLLV